MNLHIVIAVFNSKDVTLKFLDSLQKQTDQDFNVVIVDDGSKDGTSEEISKQYPDVQLVNGTGDWWWTKSTNEGIKVALKNGADYILVMNNDTYIEEDYITKIKNLGKENPGSVIGSLDVTLEEPKKVFFSGVKEIKWWKAKAYNYHNSYVLYDKSLTGLHKSICLNGRGTLIPKQVFNIIGYFDEKNLPQYASDFDFTIRVDKAGIPCYISWDAVVYSYVGQTGAGKPFIYQSWGTFLGTFFKEHSQTSISTLYRYYRKHTKWYYRHFALCMQLLRLIYSFAKRRKAFKNQTA